MAAMVPGFAYLEKYRRWALANPNLIQDLETFLRGLSYILTGYLKESVLISEFVFSSAQLLSAVNKRIIDRDVVISSQGYSRLEDFLRILNCVEVFLELATLKLWGPVARWTLIFSVQVLRTSIKLVLLFRKQKMVLPLTTEQTTDPPTVQEANLNGSFYFTLKRSGRVIRKVQGAAPVYSRSWEPPSSTTSSILTSTQFIAELIHIAQPLTHLLALGLFGDKSWSPLVISLSMDCTSQGIYASSRLTPLQRREVVRRWISLLNYILRSPFYDTKAKTLILGFLGSLERNLPLGSSLVSSLINYLPEYQKIYFYVWSQE